MNFTPRRGSPVPLPQARRELLGLRLRCRGGLSRPGSGGAARLRGPGRGQRRRGGPRAGDQARLGTRGAQPRRPHPAPQGSRARVLSPKVCGALRLHPSPARLPRAPDARPAPETRGAPGGGRAARGQGGAGPGRLHPSAPSAACPGGLRLLLPNFSLSFSLLSLSKPHPSGVTAVSPNPQSRSHLPGCGAPSLRVALSECADGRGMF